MSPLENSVWQSLKTVYDPEIPVNIADLGLIYEVKEFNGHDIHIRMTVTSPHCPAALFLPERVKEAASNTAGTGAVLVELVYEPRWTRDRMSPEAKKVLGYR